MQIEVVQQMFAVVTLLMGALIIAIISNAYRIVRQQTLLLFIYGFLS